MRQKMTPTNKGAFCKSCSKEVIDFTNMNDEEVKHYLLNRTSEKLCGRFKQQQLERIRVYLPQNIFTNHMAGWQKFMAILLLAFGTTLIGCDVILNQTAMGKASMIDTVSIKLTGDTTYTTKGMVLPPVEEAKIDTTTCSNEIMGKLIEPPIMQGTVAIINADSVIENTFINGEMMIDTVAKPTADTLIIKKKNPADTSDCGREQFY